LRDEVPDIITEDEHRAFRGLSTNEEREQFIEIFGTDAIPNRNRPPTHSGKSITAASPTLTSTSLPVFPAGKPTAAVSNHLGRPDEMESHPAGGTYDRPLEQGGGSSTTYPWELWR